MDEKQNTTKEERRLSSRYLKLNRLPTLHEVLDRKTRPPLDLFCFYVSIVSINLTQPVVMEPNQPPEA
jgi:hypothetical protein